MTMPEVVSMELVPEFVYRVTTTNALGPTDGSPLGCAQYWQLSAAELDGPRIRARLAGAGNDWMRMSPDGFWRPNVRAPFVIDDDALIMMRYTGRVEQTERSSMLRRTTPRPTTQDQYMRLALTFDTGLDRYRWLMQHLFVAAGSLLHRADRVRGLPG